jgi:hypothetical protein
VRKPGEEKRAAYLCGVSRHGPSRPVTLLHFRSCFLKNWTTHQKHTAIFTMVPDISVGQTFSNMHQTNDQPAAGAGTECLSTNSLQALWYCTGDQCNGKTTFLFVQVLFVPYVPCTSVPYLGEHSFPLFMNYKETFLRAACLKGRPLSSERGSPKSHLHEPSNAETETIRPCRHEDCGDVQGCKYTG